MAVSVDTIPTPVTGTAISSLGLTFSVANNDNRVLYGFCSHDSAGSGITWASATWGGAGMTEIADFAVGSTVRPGCYRLVNPATGSNTLTVNTDPGAVVNVVLAAASLYGADQSTPETTVRTNTASSGTGLWAGCDGVVNGLAFGWCNADQPTTIGQADGIPEYIAAGAISTATAQTSRTPAAPAGALIGDLEIATCASENNATHTWSGGANGYNWVKVDQKNQGASYTVSWAYRIRSANNADPTISWTGSADANAVRYLFRDTRTSDPPYGFTSAKGGTTTTHSSTGANTTGDDSRVIYVDHCNANTAIATPAGWTENSDAGSATGPVRCAVGGKDITTSGTGSGNISVTGGGTAWRQWQIELLNSDAGDQTTTEVENYHAGGQVCGSLDYESGQPFNSFRWTWASTIGAGALAFCVRPAVSGLEDDGEWIQVIRAA